MPDLTSADLARDLRAAAAATIPELINLPKVGEFVDAALQSFAQEKLLSITAETEGERAEHAQNLKHLIAQVRGQAIESGIREGHQIKEFIGRALQAVGNVLLKLTPGVLKLLTGAVAAP